MAKILIQSTDIELIRDALGNVKNYLVAQAIAEQSLFLLEDPRYPALTNEVIAAYARVDGLLKEYLAAEYDALRGAKEARGEELDEEDDDDGA
jgi:hypothetical protein